MARAGVMPSQDLDPFSIFPTSTLSPFIPSHIPCLCEQDCSNVRKLLFGPAIYIHPFRSNRTFALILRLIWEILTSPLPACSMGFIW